jgi:adenosine deaminase CECR1
MGKQMSFSALFATLGFDMVGQEDQGESLLFFAEQLVRFQERVAQEGLYLPFILHAGETLGDGKSTA